MRAVECRRCQLKARYSAELGGGEALDQDQRADVQRAAELVSLLELAWVNGGSADHAPEDDEAFLRLAAAASDAVSKLKLPAAPVNPACFATAVAGLMSKSAGPLGT